MANIPITCKKCGSKTFKTTSETDPLNDTARTVCANCGTPLKEDNVKAQALDIADKLVRDALRKAGLK